MTGLFVHPWGLLLLTAIPAWYWFARFAEAKRVQAARQFPDAVSRRPAWWRHLLPLSLALVAMAVAQPLRNGGRDAGNRAPDVVFLLDVSRSMGTRDHGKSRLDLARSEIRAIASRAADQRFALVVFSGNASLECPLTNDYAFLLAQLQAASRASVTLGGTRIGDAVRFAARNAFDYATHTPRELVLISDGGDESSSPMPAAAALEKRGIRLVVSGVGDAATRAPVPADETGSVPVFYQGHPVIAPLDAEALRDICRAATHCVYTELGPNSLERAVTDRTALFADTNSASVTPATVLTLAAVLLLAGEYLLRRRAQ